MVGFEEGYKFFVDNSSAIVGAEMSGSYVGTVDEEIKKLINDLNSLEGFKTSSKMLKGDVAEFWHSGTFNIKAALDGSDHRAFVDRSHDFASTDISTNFGDRYGLKFYSDGQASAKAQAVSIFQRFKEYQSSGGKDGLEKFLQDRGFDNADSILNDPINLPHHQSATRPHMSNYDRAAQFSPFAALTGHDEAIKETARLTDRKIEIDEYTKDDLNIKLQIIDDNPGTEVTITYFQPDEKKSGGAYLTVTGCVKRIDEYEQTVVFMDRTAIPIDQISEIESELFRGLELFDL